MKVKFNMIGLFVQDLPKMVQFYKEVIGLGKDWDGTGPYAEFQYDGIRFSMYERKELRKLLAQTPSFPTNIIGTFELAVNGEEPANVDAMYDRLIKGGAKEIYPPRDEPWKIRSAMITDPEGNLLEIASDFWH